MPSTSSPPPSVLSAPNVGNGLTGMMAAETERIDRVADAIVEATAPLFEDFDMARRAARAAIEAMT
jgi:hypothetical protein